MVAKKPGMKRKQGRPSKATGKRRPTPRPHHPKGTREAVIAALLTGQGVGEIARDLKLPDSTVRNYKRELSATQIAELNQKRAQQLDDMLWDHIEATFAAQKAILTHVQSPKYIQRHNPSDLAVFVGVTNDKAIRILDAIERARSPRRDDSAEDTEHPASD
jgi:DNA-binding IclR family transcriptional regulator